MRNNLCHPREGGDLSRFFIGVVLFILCLFVGIQNSHAKRVYIVIDKAKLKRSVLAMPPMVNIENDLLAADVGGQFQKVVKKDLYFSGLFDFVVPRDKRPFSGRGYELREINFKEWGALGAEFLVKGGFSVDLNEVILEMRLYEVASGRAVMGKNYRAHRDDLRKLAHRFSDGVVEALTGKKGIFQTQILFVSDKSGYKEIYTMDYDGHNIEQRTHHKSIVSSPAWLPDGKRISYSTYEKHRYHVKNLDLSILDLVTGKKRVISRQKGLNSGASWSPNGRTLALTMSHEGNPEIYTMSPNGKIIKRVTRHGAIDVESDWSPDGSRIVFSSGRAPYAHLYVMNRDGTDSNRLTFAGRYNSSPSWSPRGDQICFAGQKKGSFDLYMVSPSGKSLRRLTKSRRNSESPSFSPDGRHIVFSSNRSGKYGLYMINEDGSEEHPLLKNYGNVKLPKWSPYLD